MSKAKAAPKKKVEESESEEVSDASEDEKG